MRIDLLYKLAISVKLQTLDHYLWLRYVFTRKNIDKGVLDALFIFCRILDESW